MDSDYYNRARSGATTKTNALYIIALKRMAEIASHVADIESQKIYLQLAQSSSEAVNSVLWNEANSVYDASENDRGIISEDANAFALLADLAPSSRHASILSKVKSLETRCGMLSFNTDSGYMTTPVISPIMNSWHAEACFVSPEASVFNHGLSIMKSCWGPMVDETTPYYSGCDWEFSTPEGKPHMDHFCSLAHPFSSLPVYQLGKYALGLFPQTPGWKTFRFSPVAGFLQELKFARGRVKTEIGTIWASWEKETGSQSERYVINLEVPAGLEAMVIWPLDTTGKAPCYNGEKDSPTVRETKGDVFSIVISY